VVPHKPSEPLYVKLPPGAVIVTVSLIKVDVVLSIKEITYVPDGALKKVSVNNVVFVGPKAGFPVERFSQ
tara:strand:- start:18 stop:227 length:210 start_codon:yes stop_codon:yes gene_type:complete